MTGKALILRGDALRLPLPNESVDLVVTSSPFWSLRSYRDGGEHYDGQLGSESEWPMFLDNLIAVMAEAVRVLKPTGSIFVELGDKYAGSGGHNNAGISAHGNARGPARYNQNNGSVRAKSLMLLPERFRIRCVDELGLIARATIIWSRLNGLPESVTDRVRRSHTDVVHLTKEPRYFAAVDEVREDHSHHRRDAWDRRGDNPDDQTDARMGNNALGKLPGSVWALPSEPLIVPEAVKQFYDLPDHFAAMPTELVRRIILGWSPSGVCTVCGEGRRPVVAKEHVPHWKGGSVTVVSGDVGDGRQGTYGATGKPRVNTEATITGYACRCTPYTDHPERRRPTSTPKREDLTHRPAEDHRGSNTLPPPGPPVREYHLAGWTPPPTRPAVVLDPFSGTGTTAGVARALGRIGVGVDLSHDYSRLADYLIHRSSRFAKVVQRTHRDNQGDLFGASA